MKRLIDESGLESSDQRLAELFRAAAPFEADPFRKRRVLVNLSRVQSRRPPRFGLRPLIVAALLVSGTAAAALGQHYVARGTGFLGLGAAAPSVTPPRKPAPRPRLVRRVELAAPPSSAPATSSSALTDEPSNDAPTGSMHAAPRSGTRGRLDSSEDATHVVEAIQALRTERDPSRAQALLNEYLKAHPKGVLSEDAYALSIEAASAQHDPRAADYARRYLAKFPHGKYRALANRAIAQQL